MYFKLKYYNFLDFLADTEEKSTVSVKPKKNSWATLLGNKKSSNILNASSSSKGELLL